MIEFVDCRTCKTDCVRADGNYGYRFCDKYTHPPITNADRIRAMSDEELAELLSEPCECYVDPEEDDYRECGNKFCIEYLLNWLQQPAGVRETEAK